MTKVIQGTTFSAELEFFKEKIPRTIEIVLDVDLVRISSSHYII